MHDEKFPEILKGPYTNIATEDGDSVDLLGEVLSEATNKDKTVAPLGGNQDPIDPVAVVKYYHIFRQY